MAEAQPMDDLNDGRWMTFAELAAARGTSKRAANVLVRRHGWRRQRNNAGHVIALVPRTWQDRQDEGETHSEPHGAAHGDGAQPLLAQAVAVLESALTEANSRATSALALADRSLAQVADAEARATRLEGERDQARAGHQEALQRVRALEAADVTWRARGRLRRAWDGWRGR
jgi:hypothetical protein